MPVESFELRIGEKAFEALHKHLHRKLRDEYGAIVLAGVTYRADKIVLLARHLHLLDDTDFRPGVHGYRQFSAKAVASFAGKAGDQKLAYVAIHSHPHAGPTKLSTDDIASHQKLFPHLLDLTESQPVCGIALSQDSADGELWQVDEKPLRLSLIRVIGRELVQLGPASPAAKARPSASGQTERRFDRQARLFGDLGQKILRGMHVGVIGAGGGGSMIVEQLAHLGIGRLTIVDYDIVKEHNLSRIVGATPKDAKRGVKKIEAAKRLVKSIDPKIECQAIDGDIADLEVANKLLDCDYLFLATDTTASRLVLNAIAYRYLIPALQIGVKVETDKDEAITDIYLAIRPILPDQGCLHCQGLIDPMRLQMEQRTDEERVAQNYLGQAEVIDPSVITLNGITASQATNTMLFQAISLFERADLPHTLLFPRDDSRRFIREVKDPGCPFCSLEAHSAFAKGDPITGLPVRSSKRATRPEQKRSRLLFWRT